MSLTTDNIKYSSATAITCTLASLATSTTAGRSCAFVDNSSSLYVDAELTLAVKTSSSSGSKTVQLNFISSDGTHYEGSAAEAVDGTDKAITQDAVTNLTRRQVVIQCPGSSTYTVIIPSVASIFGGALPISWGFQVVNDTGANLDSTEANHTKSYRGITYTNQ